MANKEVVEVWEKNLASLIELAKKLLVEWGINFSDLLHFFQNIRKEDALGLIVGTHEIKKKTQPLLIRLKRVVSNILLESTASFKPRDFFKTKSEGGIFAYVDNDLFNWFDAEVKNSPAKKLASYEFTKNITEENIIGDARARRIYEETDLAHIKQICKRHIIKGEKLLKENGQANLFWVRNKKGDLCEVGVWLYGGGWGVRVCEFRPSDGWGAGACSFFRN